jgi:hypothetical protein
LKRIVLGAAAGQDDDGVEAGQHLQQLVGKGAPEGRCDFLRRKEVIGRKYGADRRVTEPGSARGAGDLLQPAGVDVHSCVDWYGNARPLFLRGRIFALLGYEIVEGRLAGGAIREARRISYAPRAVVAEGR